MFKLSITRWMVAASGYWRANSKATCANSTAERSGVGNVKCRPAFGSTAQKTSAVPQRSYSLSRLASRPGAAGEAGRMSAWSVTGFSSRHTTGSSGLQGFSYVSSTSSIFATYSSLSSATHHIFFPPRLEVVVEQQNPNGLSSCSRNQFPLHRFLGHQAHGPSGKTLRWIAANHSDNALLLAVVQQPGRSGPRLFIKRAFQAPLPVA